MLIDGNRTFPAVCLAYVASNPEHQIRTLGHTFWGSQQPSSTCSPGAFKRRYDGDMIPYVAITQPSHVVFTDRMRISAVLWSLFSVSNGFERTSYPATQITSRVVYDIYIYIVFVSQYCLSVDIYAYSIGLAAHGDEPVLHRLFIFGPLCRGRCPYTVHH